MAERDNSNLIDLTQPETSKVCHRSVSATVILGTPGPVPGMESRVLRAPTQQVPIAIAVQAPCIKEKCRMWSEQQSECREVVAAEQTLERNNLLDKRNQLEEDRQRVSAEGYNLLLAEIRELKLIVSPPRGEKRPLSVEVTGPVVFKSEGSKN